MHIGYLREHKKVRDDYEDLDVRSCEDNIKMDLRETRLGCMDWIDLALDRDQWKVLVNTAIILRVP